MMMPTQAQQAAIISMLAAASSMAARNFFMVNRVSLLNTDRTRMDMQPDTAENVTLMPDSMTPTRITSGAR